MNSVTSKTVTTSQGAEAIARPSLPRVLERLLFERPVEYLLGRIDPMWSFREARARVCRVVDESADCRTLVLRPNARFDGFEAGQSLTLHIEVGGHRIARPFAIASAPCADGSFCVTVRRDGCDPAISHLFDNIRVDDVVPISQAWGHFVMPSAARSGQLFVCDAAGLVPVLSLLLDQAYRGGIDDAVVVCTAPELERDPHFIRIQALAAAVSGLRLVAASPRLGVAAQVDPTLLRASVADLDSREVFVAGVSRFVESAAQVWGSLDGAEHLHVTRLDTAAPVALSSRRRGVRGAANGSFGAVVA
jgi:ferredoxin-NADP reductase